MVLYDDKKWMCRLIRTAFTLEDDSGACEHVLKLRPYLGDNQGEDSDSFSSDDSYDVREVIDKLGRRRSNTAIRLDKLEKKRQVQLETTHVRVNPTDGGKNELVFTRDNSYLRKNEQRLASKTVSVKKLLESVPHPSVVPFSEYARFEATTEPTLSCKRLAVYVPFLPPQHRNYPMRVAVLVNAKVSDFIGLLLFMIAHTYPSVKLHPVHYYQIQIADEEGDWDDDFPEMDNNELIGKFSFPHLALLPVKNIPTDAPLKTKVGLSFLLPNGNTFQIIVDDMDLTIGQLIRLVLSKSGWESSSISTKFANVSYHLEQLGDPNTTYTDMSLPISQCKCKEFCLVRDGARSVQNDIGKLDPQHGKPATGATESLSRSDLYPVMVSTGRFNKLKNALCVIWGGDRMDLEFQSKIKSYPLSSISGVKLDAARMRVVVSVTQVSSTGVGSHYLTSTAHLTMITSELRIATELYHHLNSILTTKTK